MNKYVGYFYKIMLMMKKNDKSVGGINKNM